MDELLSNSLFRRRLNSSRGKSRSAAARLTSGAISASAEGNNESGRASRACTASSSRSNRERLGMGPPHARAQIFQGAELQLFDRALAAPQLLGNFANTSLFYKTQDNHAALIGRQFADQPKQGGALLYLLQGYGVNVVRVLGAGQLRFAPRLPQTVGHGVAGYAIQPGCERHAAPLEAAQVSQRLLEDFGGHVLGFRAVAHTPNHERIDAFEVALVELPEAAGIALRRLDQRSLVFGFQSGSLQPVLPGRSSSPIEINRIAGE